MNRVEFLLKSREKSSVKYLEFTRVFSRMPDIMICFFEGEDVKYYGIRIEHVLGAGKWYPIECSGKKDVLEIYDVIISHPEYSDAKVAFFIDRDFDKAIPKKLRVHIYETPCYSIENLYSKKSCFKKVLEAEFKLTELCEEAESYQACMSTYDKLQGEFHNAILLVNAFIKAHRIEEKKGRVKPLNLNNVRINQLVKINLAEITCLYNKGKLKKLFPEALPIEDLEIDKIVRSFDNNNLVMELRGKYVAEFTLQFLLKLKEDRLSDTPKICKKKGPVRMNLSRRNFISELSQYADSPDCLITFLSKRKKECMGLTRNL